MNTSIQKADQRKECRQPDLAEGERGRSAEQRKYIYIEYVERRLQNKSNTVCGEII